MSAAKIEAMLDPVQEMLNELKQKSAHGQTIDPETEQKLCEKATIYSIIISYVNHSIQYTLIYYGEHYLLRRASLYMMYVLGILRIQKQNEY